mmetsp:Transcript_23663/g.34490  ORF Transcript_23663/g.34490 Transcript_23663/m.34490 type:complete len:110 (-) Transcript_23663:853-1182(-)
MPMHTSYTLLRAPSNVDTQATNGKSTKKNGNGIEHKNSVPAIYLFVNIPHFFNAKTLHCIRQGKSWVRHREGEKKQSNLCGAFSLSQKNVPRNFWSKKTIQFILPQLHP